MNSILVVVPVYNHASSIRDVVQRCLIYSPDILVVDDGSQDNVTSALAGLPITIIRHERNLGKGQAILTAARYAGEHQKTHFITIDADGQHFPEQIPDFIAASSEHPDSIILGVRDFASSNVQFSSRFGRAFGNFWVKLQTGIKIRDIQSGYRLYPVFVLNHLKFLFHTDAFEDEVIVRALWAGVSVQQIDVKVHYPGPDKRTSHFHKFHDNLRLMILNTHLTIRAIFPWPHLQIQYQNGTFSAISRPFEILRELLRNRSHPLKLALAGSLGVFLGTLPLIGCHTIVILYLASYFRLNKMLAITTSQICMPPIVPAICIETGYYLRYGRFLTLDNASSFLSNASFLDLGYMGAQRLAEWFLGSLLVGPALAAIVSGIILLALSFNIQKSI